MACRSRIAWGWLALSLLCIGYAYVALTHLDGFRWNFDEGIAVSQAWLMADGYPIYDQVWTDHTPPATRVNYCRSYWALV
jgi:D-serine deaminase-like pyridoxal phosphate-dependent protein